MAWPHFAVAGIGFARLVTAPPPTTRPRRAHRARGDLCYGTTPLLGATTNLIDEAIAAALVPIQASPPC